MGIRTRFRPLGGQFEYQDIIEHKITIDILKLSSDPRNLPFTMPIVSGNYDGIFKGYNEWYIDWGYGEPIDRYTTNSFRSEIKHTYTYNPLKGNEVTIRFYKYINSRNFTDKNFPGWKINSSVQNALITLTPFPHLKVPSQISQSGNNILKNCKNLKTIPEDLFINNPEWIDFSYAFEGTGLTEIPEGIFKYNTNATDFKHVLAFTTSLSSIPKDLFANNPEALYFNDAFRDTVMKTVPSDLFANNKKAIHFYNLFYSGQIEEVPVGLFNDLPNATRFTSCFAQCKNLTKLPDSLWINCPKANTLQNCFAGCTSLQEVPTGIFNGLTGPVSFDSVFNGCTSLTILHDNLFKHCTEATSIQDCFAGCTSLTTLPEHLFDGLQNATNATGAFLNCSNLSSLPDSLFNECINITNFSSCFSNCSSLTTLPGNLFSKAINASNFDSCFRSCSNLTTLPTGLFNSNKDISDLSSCFSGCINLTMNPDLFGGNTSLVKITDISKVYSFFAMPDNDNRFKGIAGEAPPMWNFVYGSGFDTTKNNYCFNRTKLALTNWDAIPSNWKYTTITDEE